jgi:hypothetical protein
MQALPLTIVGTRRGLSRQAGGEKRQLREYLKIAFQQAKADLFARQQMEWQTTVWRERSLLGRAWTRKVEFTGILHRGA